MSSSSSREEKKKLLTYGWLQILNAHSDFLRKVNITAAPLTFSIAGIGIPLDSLRPNNVTYSAFARPLPLYMRVLTHSVGPPRLEHVRRRLWR